VANIPPSQSELNSIRESDIDFSSAGYKRFKYIDKVYKEYSRAKPHAGEKEIYAWIRQMLRKLDAGISFDDLPKIPRASDSEALRQVAADMEEGRRNRIKEAIELLRPDINYIALCDPERGKQLEAVFVDVVMGQNIHPATLLLEWRPDLEKETKRYRALAQQFWAEQAEKGVTQ